MPTTMLRIECEKDYRHFSDRLYSIDFSIQFFDLIHVKATLVEGELKVCFRSIPDPGRNSKNFLLALRGALGPGVGNVYAVMDDNPDDILEECTWHKSQATEADFEWLHDKVEVKWPRRHPIRFYDGEEWSRQVMEKISIREAAAAQA
jgi:hypothetical protein